MRPSWNDDLSRLPSHVLKSGPKGLVTPHNFGKCVFQRRPIQRTAQAQRDRHVVVRTVGYQLIQEPEALLGERQLQHFVAAGANDQGFRRPIAPSAGAAR